MELSQKNKEIYAQNKRISDTKNREERKKEIREGRTSERKLAFLATLINAYGLNQKTFAELVGTTPQSINWLLSVRDDMKVSKAEYFLDKMGLSFKIEFASGKPNSKAIKIEENEFSSSGVKNIIKGLDVIDMKKTAAQVPVYIMNYPEDGRLDFLAKYLRTRKEPLVELCNKCGFTSNFFNLVFARNDIHISQVFKIAQATDQEIVWSIDKK